MKKRIASILMTLCMVVSLFSGMSAAFADGSAQLIVSTQTAKVGDEVTLSVSTANNPGVAVLTLGINYDEAKLELVGFENSGFTGWTVKTSAVWVGDSDSTYNGEILKLKFKVLDGASGKAEVSLRCGNGDAYNYNEEPISFEIVSGGVIIEQGHTHSYTEKVTAPTCTEEGYTTHTCACGDTYIDDYRDAYGHDLIYIADIDAKCTESGSEPYEYCNRCDYTTWTADKEVPALGHDYINGICSRCGEADPDYKFAPDAPELKITTSSGKPKVYWNEVDWAVKYWLYRSTDGVNFKYYDSTTSTNYTNRSTTIGTTYYYKIKAIDANDARSEFSVVKSILCKPAAPTLSINRSNGKPKLSWKAVSGAKKYWVYRSTDGVNFKYWDSTTKTTYTNKGAASGTKYYYRVKAVAVVNGNNVASANSSTKSLMTTLAKPSVSITTSGGKPKLTWNAVTSADKYYIYRSTDGKNFKYWESTTKTYYTNTGAKKNTRYYYKVKAVCASNSYANSAQSSTVSIKATK